MTTLTEVHEPVMAERPVPEVETRKSPPAPFVEPPLFASVLLEVDSTEKRRRKWSALSSVVVQSLVFGIVLALPLMFTDALPRQQLLTYLVAPPPPPPPPPPAAAPAVQVVRRVESDLLNGRLRAPSRIPQKVEMIREEETPPPLMSGEGVVGGVPGGIPGGQLGGVIGGIISSTKVASVPKLAPEPKRLRVSQGVIAGMLAHRVEPVYPSLARAARVQGQVVLTAIISKEGTIENLQVVKGHPMLIPAALAAVEQWRYRPFMLNGEPVEVETTVIVTFEFAN